LEKEAKIYSKWKELIAPKYKEWKTAVISFIVSLLRSLLEEYNIL